MSETKWAIQYTDESGGHVMRETSDIGEVHATVEFIVDEAERIEGYAGQTATWHGYESRDGNPNGRGNWSLDIVNLDTHTPDGYEIEIETDAPAMVIAPKDERVRIMADMLTGLTKLPTTKYNLWVETGRTIPAWQRANTDIIVRKTNGSVLTEELWRIRLYHTEPTVIVNHHGVDAEYTNPMDALVALYEAMQK